MKIGNDRWSALGKSRGRKKALHGRKKTNGWKNSRNTKKNIMGRQLHFRISSAAAAAPYTQISFLYYCKKFQHKFSCRLRPLGKSKLKITIANSQFLKRRHYFKMALKECLYTSSLAKFKGFP